MSRGSWNQSPVDTEGQLYILKVSKLVRPPHPRSKNNKEGQTSLVPLFLPKSTSAASPTRSSSKVLAELVHPSPPHWCAPTSQPSSHCQRARGYSILAGLPPGLSRSLTGHLFVREQTEWPCDNKMRPCYIHTIIMLFPVSSRIRTRFTMASQPPLPLVLSALASTAFL